MLFTIKRPKSQRFFQLSFKGFVPEGRNNAERFINSTKDFWSALLRYFASKAKKLGNLTVLVIKWVFHFPTKIKSFIVRKLIWSRGRLGRPIAITGVLGFFFLVFMFGEVFSGSSLVVSQKIDEDYLKTASDIIPRRHIATTEVPDIRKRIQSMEYIVEGGDTISSIGEKFKVAVDALKYVNNLTDYSVIKPGQKMTIPPVSGLVHKVESGDTLSSIALKYDVAPQAIADFNYLLDTSSLKVGVDLVIPDAKIPQPVIPIEPITPYYPGGSQYAQATPSRSFCVWPSTVRIITQYYSWYHNGIDVASPIGASMPPLFACRGGTVVRAGWDPWGLGLHVRIDHGNGYETVYGHMSRLDVSYGTEVDRGQIIGLMGSTGRSTGPHVHYMVKFNGIAQNPLEYTN